MPTKYADDVLKSHTLPSFAEGYNSYSAGKSTVTDKEFPYGLNVVLDNNGSATKVSGKQAFGGEIASGKAITGMGLLYNASHNKVICSAGTAWYYADGTNAGAALTGVTFTDNLPTDFCQAIDRLYGANGTDNLAYTTDGAAITEVSSNGNIGRWPTYYNQRLYMTNSTYKDRIYYSNPITVTESSYDVGNFGTFNTDLAATPKKNAGFIILIPGGGVEINRLFLDNTSGADYIYAYTKRHGIWRIAYSAINDDGSIAHTIVQVQTDAKCPAGRAVHKVGNDQWFYEGERISTLGEVVNYQNIRKTDKSARIRTEINSVAPAYKQNAALGFYKDKLFFAYTTGTYNDRLEIWDSKLNAWSTPIQGKNVSCFLEYETSGGVTKFLAGSSNSADSYIYELETGSNDVSTAINGYFETKSTDCNKPGLIKRFAFIDVFYTMVYGVLTYEVFVDEVSSITGSMTLGNSTDIPAGFGSQPFGSFPVGAEYDADTTFASLAQNDSFRIDCGYTAGKKISVRFTNNNTGEQFKIDSLTIHYLEGDVYET